jgi:hypothetical protein
VAARTNAALVEGVLLSNYDGVTRPSLQPFIVTAGRIVDRLVLKAADRAVAIGIVDAELVERWLAAYLYMNGPDPGYTSRSTSGASGSFTTKGDEYLNTAAALDPSGLLLGILKGQRAGGEWLGLTPSGQTPYWERD